MTVGDKVKVIDQDIWGVIVQEGWSGNTVIIEESTSDYDIDLFETPFDSRLEFRKSDLEKVK